MRLPIACLLIAALAAAGCDRQSDQPEQAKPSAAPIATADAADTADAGDTGTLDRSHAGEAAPDIRFTNPDGARVSFADFRGKPMLLSLWATWCAPCIKEMPTLDTLAGDLGDDVQVVAVSEDLGGADKVDPFFAKAGFARLKPYLDPKLALTTAYNANLPTTILYDAKGKEVWRVTGGMDWTSKRARTLVGEARG